jgi:hypothetical protein
VKKAGVRKENEVESALLVMPQDLTQSQPMPLIPNWYNDDDSMLAGTATENVFAVAFGVARPMEIFLFYFTIYS